MTARLRVCVVGLGRMGRAVEAVASARGHEVVARVDPRGGDVISCAEVDASAVDVAIEFTVADAAPANLATLVERGIATVSGTTGWPESELRAVREAARERGVGFLWAPNFSIGMQVLFRLAAGAGRSFGALGGFAPFVEERHHAGKKDAPSGSACRLASLVVEASPGKSRFDAAPREGAVPDDVVPVGWVRAGSIPGEHVVGWDGTFETLELTHRVRDRAVFAEGAVRAAEWLAARRGPHDIDEMLDDLLAER